MQNIPLSILKIKKYVSYFLIAATLAACGGGGGGGTSEGQVTRVEVVPALGGFSQGATVSAYTATGTLLASGVTNADGKVSALQIPASHTGPVLLKVRGGADVTYFDEGTGNTRAFGASDTLMSVIPASRVTADAAFGVTPLTHMLAALAGVDADNAVPTLAGSNPDQDIALAEKALQVLLPIPLDFLAAPAPFRSAADMSVSKAATEDSAVYGALLAELAKSSTYASALDQAKALATQTAAAKAKTNAVDFGNAFTLVSNAIFTAAEQLETSPLLSGDKSKVTQAAVARGAAVAASDYFAIKDNLDALKVFEDDVKVGVETQAELARSFPIANLQGVYRNDANTVRALANADGTFLLLDTRTGAPSVYIARIEATSQGYSVSGRVIGNSNGTFNSDTFSPLALATEEGGAIALTIDTRITLSRDDSYDARLSLASLAGDWSKTLSLLNKVDWSITSTGVISGESSTGCTWAGKVKERNEGRGVLNVTVKESCVNGEETEFDGLLSFAGADTSGDLVVTLFDRERTKYSLIAFQAAP